VEYWSNAFSHAALQPYPKAGSASPLAQETHANASLNVWWITSIEHQEKKAMMRDEMVMSFYKNQ
jgi:hypothetical protein